MTPMPLSAAVKVCFPHGGASVSTLRKAIVTGALEAEYVGGKVRGFER